MCKLQRQNLRNVCPFPSYQLQGEQGESQVKIAAAEMPPQKHSFAGKEEDAPKEGANPNTLLKNVCFYTALVPLVMEM